MLDWEDGVITAHAGRAYVRRGLGVTALAAEGVAAPTPTGGEYIPTFRPRRRG